MVRRVEVVPHDPEWAQSFETESKKIQTILNHEVIAIHHIGSTAIQNINAKPIIDLLVEVRDILRIDNFDQEFIQLGYIPKGESGIPKRRLYIKGTEESRTHHVHIFQRGNPEIERLLNFRDYLIANLEDAQTYSKLKVELARKFPEDIDRYIEGKDEFIQEIDRKAKVWREK